MTVVEYAGKDKHKKAQWFCKCDCGNTKIISSNSLNTGKTTSCGCYWREEIKKANSINIIGEKYGKLTVIERLDNSVFKCICECGGITNVYIGNLRRGEVKSCGCLSRTNKDGIVSPIDLTGMRFGKLVVQTKDSKTNEWICKCDCGNIKKVKRTYLLNGDTKSCGCIRIHNLKGQRFGKLTVISLSGTNKHNTAEWKCQCDCGNTTVVSSNCLTSGDTKSCGCLTSLGELAVGEVLNKYNIKHKTQQKFPNTEIDGLRYDFGILDANNKVIGLIEYDGRQHFEPFSFYKATHEEKVKNFLDLSKRDELKTMFAFNNNIPLLRIKFNNKNVEEEILAFMKDHNIWDKMNIKELENVS